MRHLRLCGANYACGAMRPEAYVFLANFSKMADLSHLVNHKSLWWISTGYPADLLRFMANECLDPVCGQ